VHGKPAQRAGRVKQDKACIRSYIFIPLLLFCLTTKGAVKSLWRKKVQHKACTTKESKSSNKDPTIPLTSPLAGIHMVHSVSNSAKEGFDWNYGLSG